MGHIPFRWNGKVQNGNVTIFMRPTVGLLNYNIVGGSAHVYTCTPLATLCNNIGYMYCAISSL